MRGWLTFSMLIVLFLSGCATKVDTDGSSTVAVSVSSTYGSGNASFAAPPTSASNHAPIALLNASALHGLAPFVVNFTVAGADLDNDTLSWTLSFGDNSTANGTTLPSVVAHNFTLAGNHTVVLDVTDGIAHTNTSLVIAVAGGPAWGPKQDDIQQTGSVMCLPTIVVNGEISGGSNTFKVDPGQSKFTFTLSYDDPTVEDLDLSITDPAGTVTKSAEAGPEPPLDFVAPLAGDWNVAVTGYSCAGTLDYTIAVHFA